MLTAGAVTIAFLPAYLLLRAPFRRLPLHTDTGYYVSGFTMAGGRVHYRAGWNARFAGCSKVVPEYFYSLVYLLHCRKTGVFDPDSGAIYKRHSRLYASMFNYLTAVAVGVLAAYLSGWDPSYYCAGLIVFGLVSSEPQWGVYSECGELFELPGHIVSVGCLVYGLHGGGPVWVGLAALTWCLSAFFVKLSALIGFVVLFGIVILIVPWSAGAVLAGGACASTVYLVWVRLNGRRPLDLVRGLAGHEASFGQRADRRLIAHRMREKSIGLWRTILNQPLVPILAGVGVVAGGAVTDGAGGLLSAYFAAVLITYASQATDCRYYQIPLLGPFALLAAQGAVALAASAPFAAVLLFGALIWIGRNTWRAVRLDVRGLNRWCWNGALSDEAVMRNERLDVAVREWQGIVAGRSMLVYGPMNQAYVLAGSFYPTALVAPEHCLDDVCPNWQPTFNETLTASPPSFILDTGNCFDAAAARTGLGLDYRLTRVFDAAFRLYALTERTNPAADIASVRTFRPQFEASLRAEEEMAADEFAICGRREQSADGHVVTADADGRVLADVLRELARRGHRTVGVYGAGRYTARHADVYRLSKVRVAVVLDDHPDRHGTRYLDWPVRRLEEADRFGVDAVIVSTDRFAGPMTARAREVWGGRIAVFSAQHAPEGPARVTDGEPRGAATPVSVEPS